jgi:glycosyltransferase Alg8
MAASVALAALWLPPLLDRPGLRTAAVSIGFLGVWRYSWWLTHLVRALVYQYRVFPRLRSAAEVAWRNGTRPRRIHFMMTTFREDPEITRAVLNSIVEQCRECGCPATLFIGTGHPDDERVIRACFEELDLPVDLEVTVIRQSYPGKRMAIGLVLRAMSREGIDGNDPVVFLDGDTILEAGCVAKCISLFATGPDIDALTTDERAIVRGPGWMQHWLDMRFAQRHLTMQSHALSRKVLTLTGRMSVFRAHAVVQEEFISTIENDYLDHWLWGRFRFLSGDDKSSWYVLLRSGAQMLYVPDAITWTIERVEGNGVERMRANLLRWSGNMLRNGTRALALGPRRVGPFIWWCVLDQRIATWSTLVGPIAALGAVVYSTPWAIVAYFAWVLGVRMMASFVLFAYARKIDATFPLLLYASQLLNAATKAYIWFRLPMQRWSNRGDQRAAFGSGSGARARLLVANGLTYLSVLALTAVVLVYMQRAFG